MSAAYTGFDSRTDPLCCLYSLSPPNALVRGNEREGKSLPRPKLVTVNDWDCFNCPLPSHQINSTRLGLAKIRVVNQTRPEQITDTDTDRDRPGPGTNSPCRVSLLSCDKSD